MFKSVKPEYTEYIVVSFNTRLYAFRPCDTKGMTRDEVQKLTDETGRMQYERGHAYLVVHGVGYAWETDEESAMEWADANDWVCMLP